MAKAQARNKMFSESSSSYVNFQLIVKSLQEKKTREKKGVRKGHKIHILRILSSHSHVLASLKNLIIFLRNLRSCEVSKHNTVWRQQIRVRKKGINIIFLCLISIALECALDGVRDLPKFYNTTAHRHGVLFLEEEREKNCWNLLTWQRQNTGRNTSSEGE